MPTECEHCTALQAELALARRKLELVCHGDWTVFGHPSNKRNSLADIVYLLESIRDLFARIDAGEDVLHPADHVAVAEAASDQARSEQAYMIVFDDADEKPETFYGLGAQQAALSRWAQISLSWNAHLFRRIGTNYRV